MTSYLILELPGYNLSLICDDHVKHMLRNHIKKSIHSVHRTYGGKTNYHYNHYTSEEFNAIADILKNNMDRYNHIERRTLPRHEHTPVNGDPRTVVAINTAGSVYRFKDPDYLRTNPVNTPTDDLLDQYAGEKLEE